jgi:pimeloyl-ACP methyl ester carboxylesterase
MAKSESGIVYVIDGAGASGFLPFVMQFSLNRLPHKMSHFRWGCGYGRIIADLKNRDHMREKASELGRSIKQYRSANAGHPVFVVAKSAGTAVALWALSESENDAVERAILLSPAVSPVFPIDQALPAVRREIVSFWSPYDLFYLGLGTSLFGTADGVVGKSAGLVGFSHSGDHKLRQVKWEPSMIRSLNPGTHFGTSMPPFINRFVLPLLKTEG